MTKAEKAIRAALAAGPTPGPWSWWTSCSFRRLSSDATMRDGDVLRAVVHRDGVGDIAGTDATKDFIAACNPKNITALLAEIERLQVTVDRLQQQWAENEPAVRYKAERDALRQDAERYRHVRRDPSMLLHLRGSEFDAAIDAALAQDYSPNLEIGKRIRALAQAKET